MNFYTLVFLFIFKRRNFKYIKGNGIIAFDFSYIFIFFHSLIRETVKNDNSSLFFFQILILFIATLFLLILFLMSLLASCVVLVLYYYTFILVFFCIFLLISHSYCCSLLFSYNPSRKTNLKELI